MSGKAERAAGPLIERLREVHLAMVEAVLGGDGLREVARLASQATGAPVAIVVPRLETVAAWPENVDIDPLRAYVADRLRDRPANVPPAPSRARRTDRRVVLPAFHWPTSSVTFPAAR